MTELLLESEVASLLHRSRRFVRQLRQTGELQWIPGAGRAPLLIPKQSVDNYIERTLRWHANNFHPGSSKTTAPGTSRSRTMGAASEQAFGRAIFKSRKLGFKVG
jgi:hypothetical protein